MDSVRFRAVVSGSVQGVGFRWATRSEAQRLGLTGFVTNRADATVEVEAQGDASAAEALKRWLRSGPPAADVKAVESEPLPIGDGTGFEVR